jgi:FKBP-type peptidyl-prolyl cis-trans isomerase 2
MTRGVAKQSPMELEAESDAGEVVYLRVVELDEVVARLDENHPLACQRVALELSVIDLRAASPVELAVAELERVKNAEQAPDVLVSDLLRRDRFTPPHSG